MYDMWVWVKTLVARKVAAMTRFFIPNSSGHMEVVTLFLLPIDCHRDQSQPQPFGYLPDICVIMILGSLGSLPNVDMDGDIPMESAGGIAHPSVVRP